MARESLIELRKDTAADWTSADPTLNSGECGFEEDTGLLKIGDGSTAWTSLEYIQRDQARIIGIRWKTDATSPTLAYVDINKNVITLPSTFFDDHVIWGHIRRCTLTDAGIATYGSNARGTGLTLDGTTGNVMVECPKFWWKCEYESPYLYIWYSPIETTGFEVHPWFYQRDNVGSPADHAYWSAYEATLKDADGTLELLSKTGEQPLTGYWSASLDGFWKLSYTGGGTTEIVAGETLTGATSGATGVVVTHGTTGGTWGGGDAAGDIYVKTHNNSTAFQSENLNGSTAGDDCCTIGAAGSSLGFVIADSETYGNNVGAGWGSENFWAWNARQILMYADIGSLQAQTALTTKARGVVDKASGTGFAGEETGADSADTNVGTNGTGSGTGTDGLTPVVWRGCENPYGNVYTFITGYIAIDAAYHIIKKIGIATADIDTTLGAGTYDTSAAAPITSDGYISDVVNNDAMLMGAFIPSETSGSETTYVCDRFYAHDAGETNSLSGGGDWYHGGNGGPGFLVLCYDASFSDRYIGARLEFIPARREFIP